MDTEITHEKGHHLRDSLQYLRVCTAVLLAVALIYVCTTAIHRIYFHPLRNVPGPLLAAVTDWYAVYIARGGQQHIDQYKLHLRYGPVVRFQPNRVLVQSPSTLPLIYHRHAEKPWGWYGPFHGVETVHSMSRHDDHARRRRSVLPAYAPRAVQTQLPVIDRITRVWFDHLGHMISSSKDIDLADEAMRFSRDLWMEVIFGQRMECIERGSDVLGMHRYDMIYRAIHEVIAFIPTFKAFAMANPLLRYFLVPPDDPTSGDGWIFANARQLHQSHQNGTLNKEEKKEPQIKDQFLAMGLDQETFASEIRVMVGAASGPLGAALAECITNIVDHPGAGCRIDEEMAQALESRGLADAQQLLTGPCDLSLTLPYFDACLRETLRGSGISTFMYPRVVPEDGMTLCGHYIPAGCTAASVPWIVARSQEIYGTDADRFRPERWLEVDDETRKQWNKWDFTFGFGARRCLGRGFAETILWRVAMLFLARFQVKRVEGENREAVDFTPRAGQRIGEQRFEIVAKSGAAERSASGS